MGPMASYDLNDPEVGSLDSPEDNLEGALLHPAASLSDKALTALLPAFIAAQSVALDHFLLGLICAFDSQPIALLL